MSVIRVGIHKMLVRIAHREDPELTASEEAVRSVSAPLVKAFLASVRNFQTFSIHLYFHYRKLLENNISSN